MHFTLNLVLASDWSLVIFDRIPDLSNFLSGSCFDVADGPNGQILSIRKSNLLLFLPFDFYCTPLTSSLESHFDYCTLFQNLRHRL